MKPKKTPFSSLRQPVGTAALAAALLACSSSAQAQSWDGGSTSSNSWGAADNWNPNTAPTFGTGANLTFNNLTRPNNDLGGSRIVRSLSYGADMDSDFLTNFRTFDGGTSSTLTFQAASGNASITVSGGATGNINLGWGGTGTVGGLLVLASNLDIVHNGLGNLTFSRGISGTGFGFTKSGTGTIVSSNFASNTFTGAANFNEGRAIFGNTNSATGDLSSASAVNFGGGTLEIRTTTAINKILTSNTIVSAASTLAYNNTAATDQSLTIQTGTMALNANLTVQNISSSAGNNNIINISRSITGSGTLIVDTYNSVTSGGSTFSNGRVQLSGDNTAWTGSLVVAKGTAQFSGTNSFVPTAGSITLGTTASASGAGLGFNQLATDANLGNTITVTTGSGLRLIRNNAGPGSTNNITLSGGVTLDGSLTIDHAGLGSGKAVTLSGDVAGAGGLNVTFVGPHPISDTSVRLTGNNSYSGNTTVGAGATLVVNSTSGNGIGNNSAVSLTGTGAALQLEVSETIGSLASTGAVGSLALTGSLTTGGDNTNTTYGGSSTGAGGLTKAGDSSTFTLTGTNSYSGATNVSSGRLTIGSTGTINGTSGVTIGAGELRYNSSTALSQAVSFSTTGGTLSGTGTVTPTVNITTGNTLAVGDGGIGTLSLGSALTVGGTYLYELNGGTSLADLGNVMGNLVLGGILDLVQLEAYTAGDKFTLFAYDGSLSGVFKDSGLVNIADDTTFIDGGGVWTINYNDGTAGLNGGVSANNTYVTITAIPEPNAAALLGGLGTLLLLRRRRA